MIFKRFRTFINESPESVAADLTDLGFGIKNKTRNKITVLTDADRKLAQKEIVHAMGGKWTPDSASSIGSVVVDGIKVYVKSTGKQGKGSAGIDNEHLLVEQIMQHVPVNVTFKDTHGKKVTYRNIVEAKTVGNDTSGRKKADIVLIDGRGVPIAISIKKDNAEYWESADKTFGPMVRKVIDKMEKAGEVDLIQMEAGHYKVKPEIKIPMYPEEVQSVVFGSDIQAHGGAVIKRTFSQEDFSIDRQDNIIIQVTSIIQKVEDIDPSEFPWILVRNDMTRNKGGKSIYPGLRILVAYAKRVMRVKEVTH